MAEPQLPQRAPYPKDLEPGDYWWCACGRSANQPFCDGSHKGSEFQPMKFTVPPDSGKLWLCGCKRSDHKPFCDGTHNKLGNPPG
jgi:CDGSH iron-sulfur domain-containing protein 3